MILPHQDLVAQLICATALGPKLPLIHLLGRCVHQVVAVVATVLPHSQRTGQIYLRCSHFLISHFS